MVQLQLTNRPTHQLKITLGHIRKPRLFGRITIPVEETRPAELMRLADVDRRTKHEQLVGLFESSEDGRRCVGDVIGIEMIPARPVVLVELDDRKQADEGPPAELTVDAGGLKAIEVQDVDLAECVVG